VRRLVAGLVELVVIEGGGSAPITAAGAAPGGVGRGPLGRGVFGGLFVPPAVIDRSDGAGQAGADGLGVAAGDPLDHPLAGADRAGHPG
jgi:hypothetical protein